MMLFGRPTSAWRRCLAAVAMAASFAAAPAHAQTVTVFAAASLRDAVEEIARRFQDRTGVRVRSSYAGSGALARQIENGAPAEIYVSADLEWMDYLQRKGLLVPGSRVNLLRNELVLVAPASSAIKVEIKKGFPLARLLGAGRLAMADPDTVPAGKYGKASLQALGVWDAVAGRLARADNVRTALMFVARGEAPLGIVYRTDAAAERKVRIVGLFPAETHPPVVYPMALVKGAGSAAKEFYAFLMSDNAAEAFGRHGFMRY